MNLNVTPFIDRYHDLVNLFYHDPANDSSELPYQQVVSVKSKEKKPKSAAETEMSNHSRQVWKFLTFGIPSLFEALSLFFSGIVHRKTSGAPIKIGFNAELLSNQEAEELYRFQHYNKFSHKPLKHAEFTKISRCVNRLMIRMEAANAANDKEGLERAKEELKPYQLLLEKVRDSKITRKDFDEDDWKVMDTVNFELATEYFSGLVGLFNSPWMIHSGLQVKVMERFNIDYNESVVAESLSLALAYIENIDGKKISLPLFDYETRQYRPVEYQIKKTTIGDNLPCYVLEAEDPSVTPWFIIRGTQSFTNISKNGNECRTGSLESMLADSLDPECISRNVLNKSLVKRPIVFENGRYVQKESLSDIFMKWKGEGKQVKLAGHSLGGTLVNALSVEFFDQIEKAYAFSAPGVSYETAERWHEVVKENEDQAAQKLINYDYEGDIVPAGGKVLVGSHFAVESLHEWVPEGLHDSHVRSRLNRDFKIYQVDVKAENKKFARGFCEKLRIITGLCFRVLLWCFDRKFLPDWWRNRKIYREYAGIEREIRRLSN